MALTLEDEVKCPECKKVSAICNLVPVQGAPLFKQSDGSFPHQIDYLCPHCEKLVVCDTSGQGGFVLQNVGCLSS